MKIFFYKQLSAIKFIGEDSRQAKELLVRPIPKLEMDDILIVPEQTAKFLSRDGSPFERVNLEESLKSGVFIEAIADDAVATIESLKAEKFELEAELETKNTALLEFENREHDEILELKTINKNLNDDADLCLTKKNDEIKSLENQIKTKDDEINYLKQPVDKYPEAEKAAPKTRAKKVIPTKTPTTKEKI